MATYSFVEVESDFIGSTEIKVLSQTINLNEFINSVGIAPYELRSFDIWSDNLAQLTQPIRIQRNDANGNALEYSKYPQLDSYQKQQQINNFAMDNFPFDGESVILYDILPKTKVKISININEKDYKKISKTQHLVESMGLKQRPIIKYVLETLGIEEIEEFNEKLIKAYPTLYSELDEDEPTKTLESIKESILGKGEKEEFAWEQQKKESKDEEKPKMTNKQTNVKTVFSLKGAIILAGIAIVFNYNK